MGPESKHTSSRYPFKNLIGNKSQETVVLKAEGDHVNDAVCSGYHMGFSGKSY